MFAFWGDHLRFQLMSRLKKIETFQNLCLGGDGISTDDIWPAKPDGVRGRSISIQHH
jgi:hypothetical protein